MGLARSTFYDVPPVPLEPDALLTRISAICDEFECYGYRRVGAALRHQGVVVNGKKLRRLMREHDLQPKRRRRYVITTDSDHAGPIFPALAKDIAPERPNQLWVADLTYVAIPRASSISPPFSTPGHARSLVTRSADPWTPASPSLL
jgi:putative transposase